MEREQVEAFYKWNTEEIFASDDNWEKAYGEIEKEINFGCYAGKLGDKATLLKLLKANDEFLIKFEKLLSYANLKHDEDTRVTKYISYSGKMEILYSKYCAEMSFYEPEMASLDESYLLSLLDDANFSDYDYQIKILIKHRPHAVSQAEEKIVALSAETLSTFMETFGMIDNVDLPTPEIEVDGQSKKLTNGLFGLLLHSTDREKRKEAYYKFYGAYISLLNTITSIFYGNIKKDVFLSKVYKFDSCLEQALFSEDVDRKVYDNLLENVKKSCPLMHRYISDRKKILGYDKLCFYDIYAPLVDDVELKMTYDEAYECVLEGLAPLGEEYIRLLKNAHDSRWIDVMETDGKRNGAYSASVYGVHPYVLLNYQKTISDIFTIAHEMGHAMHTHFSLSNQPYAKSEYKIFVAEVASTVNEVMLLKYLYSKADDKKLKQYLLNYYLDSIRATLHRQTMFAEFEYSVHDLVEKGEPLNRENICEIYSQLGKDYYGDSIEHDHEISCEWCRVPHFYTSFYVYKYATGIISAMNIVHRILTEGENAVKDYFRFLSGGSSTDPVSLLQLAGVDLTKNEPFEFAMKEFEDTLVEFEKLMEI